MDKIKKMRKEYQSWKRGYYHLSTDGLKAGKLFYTNEQFAYGMTLVGLTTLYYAVTVYDFTLMDNHLHLLMSGTGAECVRTFDYLRRKISARLVKDGYPPLPEDYFFKLTPVVDEEQMRINYLYIDRNILERGVSLPGGYPWGAAYLHFSSLAKQLRGTPAGKLHVRKLMSFTGSHMPIPSSWEFHPELGLLPGSWMDHTLFKKLFSSAKDYQTRLVKDYEAFIKLGRRLDETQILSEYEIRDVAQQLSNITFPGKRMKDLSNPEKGRMCALLQDRYGLTPAQIAEALYISEHLVKQLLVSKDFGIKTWR